MLSKDHLAETAARTKPAKPGKHYWSNQYLHRTFLLLAMSTRNLLRQGSTRSVRSSVYEDDDEEETARSSVRNVSPEKREWIRNESEAILAKNLMLREKTKQDMFEKRLQHEKLMQVAREKRDSRWKSKTKHSPFAVNLVAEDERITEENAIRIKEETDRRNEMEARKHKAKNEIILKALSEFSDLEALRKEKRAIMDEEQRLKALLSLEKVRRVCM
jgi:hypothetical protein